VLFFLGNSLKKLLSSATNMVASAASLLVLLQQHVLLAALFVCLGLALMVVGAVTRYWFFRFKVDEERIQIRQGVFKKTELDMRFERIQGINTEQSLIYRLVGLVAVRFDTAGSTGSEGYVPAVSTGFADELRARVESMRVPVEDTVLQSAPSDVLVRLGRAEVLRVGLTDPRVLQAALAGLASLPVLLQVDEKTRGAVLGVAKEVVVDIVGHGPLATSIVVLGALIALALLLAIVSIVVVTLRYHGFELRREGTAFRSSAGLLTRKDVVVEAGKIQEVRLVQGVAMRWLKRFRVQALPATSGVPVGRDRVEQLIVPLLGDRTVATVRSSIFGREGWGLNLLPSSDRFVPVSAYYIWPRALWRGFVPAAVATAVLVPLFGEIGLLGLGWFVVVVLFAWQRWRRLAYLHDNDGMVFREGLLGYRTNAFLFRKVQRATVFRSPLQRRKGLADLVVHLASGVVQVPYIDHGTARRLQDYILFKAESSKRAWF